MNNQTELLERQRIKFLRNYLLAFVAAVVLMLTRYFFRLSGLNESLLGYLITAGAVIAVVIMAALIFKQISLAKRINTDPDLKEALNNELVQNLELRSWRAAFIGSVATNIFFAFSNAFYPLCDSVMIALMSIIVGAGSHRAYFYFKYRAL